MPTTKCPNCRRIITIEMDELSTWIQCAKCEQDFVPLTGETRPNPRKGSTPGRKVSAKSTLITFDCPGCGKTHSVKDDFGGKKAKCPKCGALLLVPTPPLVANEPDYVPYVPDDSTPATFGSEPQEPAQTSPATTRLCEWCSESIPTEAVKCPFCQNWRKDIKRNRELGYRWVVGGILGIALTVLLILVFFVSGFTSD